MKLASMKNIVHYIFSPSLSTHDRLDKLIAEFGLDGKVDWNVRCEYGRATITPVRIVIDDSERGVPLPKQFLSATSKILEKEQRKIGFSVVHAELKWMSLGEIKAEIQRWKEYCDWAWAGAGG